MVNKIQQAEFKAKVKDVLAKYDMLGFSEEHENFLKSVYPLTLSNLLASYPTLLLQIALYSLIFAGSLYLLIFSGHFYLVKALYLTLLVLSFGLMLRTYNFYHHFGRLTKMKGTWRKARVLINPSLPERKLVEVIIHEFYHFLEMKGLVREEGETFASAVGFDAAVMAGADPCDTPEFLFGFWVAATCKDPNAVDQRIRFGPGMTHKEFLQFKKWLLLGKLVSGSGKVVRKLTEEQKANALRYFERRLEEADARKKPRRKSKKSETEIRKERFDKLANEGASLGEKGDHGAALERFMEAREIARALKHSDLELLSLNLIGMAFSRSGRTDEAVQTLSQALEIAEVSGNCGVRNEVMRTLGVTYMEAGHLDQALKVFQDLALIEKSEHKQEDFAKTVSQVGHILVAMGRTAEALRCFSLAGRVSRQLGLLDEHASDEDANH